MPLLRSVLLGSFAGVALARATTSSIERPEIPKYIESAIQDPRRAVVVGPWRTEPDNVRDATQKPAEVLSFAGVKPGFKVADFQPAPPYSTALLSAVLGPSGRVYGIVPEKVARETPAGNIDLLKWLAPYSSNTSLLIEPLEQLTVPDPLDLVYLGKIHHDFPNEKEMASSEESVDGFWLWELPKCVI